MMRRLLNVTALPIACAVLAVVIASLITFPTRADTINVSALPFPLASNIVFPARSNRLLLKCYNPPANGAAQITYASGFTFTMVPGASLWETSRVPSGVISATGTAGNVISCEELYQ